MAVADKLKDTVVELRNLGGVEDQDTTTAEHDHRRNTAPTLRGRAAGGRTNRIKTEAR